MCAVSPEFSGGRDYATFAVSKAKAKTVVGDDATIATSNQITAIVEFGAWPASTRAGDENPFLELGDIEDNGLDSVKSNPDKDAIIEPAISAEQNNNLSELNESAAIAEDPTENGDFENRFDQSIVDALIQALQARPSMVTLTLSAMFPPARVLPQFVSPVEPSH